MVLKDNGAAKSLRKSAIDEFVGLASRTFVFNLRFPLIQIDL